MRLSLSSFNNKEDARVETKLKVYMLKHCGLFLKNDNEDLCKTDKIKFVVNVCLLNKFDITENI